MRSLIRKIPLGCVVVPLGILISCSLSFAACFYVLFVGWGLSPFQKMLDNCTLANGGVIRLYRGDGGSTTAYSYSATLQEGFLEQQRAFFFSYAGPEITGVECKGQIVKLKTTGLPYTFSLETIRLQYLNKPMDFYRGVEREGSTLAREQNTTLFISMIVFAIVCILFFIGYLFLRRM